MNRTNTTDAVRLTLLVTPSPDGGRLDRRQFIRHRPLARASRNNGFIMRGAAR